MGCDNYILAMSEMARRAIEAGEAYRKGGVVYSIKGGIIEHLHDAELLKNPSIAVQNLVNASMIPMAVFAVSMLAINHRLSKIEDTLHEINLQLQEIKQDIQLSNLKLDAHLIGRLNGTIHSCRIDLDEGRTNRMEGYRQTFLETYQTLKSFIFSIARSKDNFKNNEELFKQYMRAMFLSGMAARDLSFRLGEANTTISLSATLANDAQELHTLIHAIIDNFSALFWRNNQHLDIAVEIRESSDRLSTHTALLNELPGATLAKLINHQINV